MDTFTSFSNKVKAELQSTSLGDPDGEQAQSPEIIYKSDAAKEVEDKGRFKVLTTRPFLREVYQLIQKYERYPDQRLDAEQLERDSRSVLKSCRDIRERLTTLSQEIKQLHSELKPKELSDDATPEEWSKSYQSVTLERELLVKMFESSELLEDVAYALLKRDQQTVLELHPRTRKKTDEAAGWVPILPSHHYDLEQFKVHAPDQWLWKSLRNKIKSQLQRYKKPVTKETEYVIVSVFCKCSGHYCTRSAIKQFFCRLQRQKTSV